MERTDRLSPILYVFSEAVKPDCLPVIPKDDRTVVDMTCEMSYIPCISQ